MSWPLGPMRMSRGGGPLSVAHHGLFPQRREHDGSASQPEPHEWAMLTADAVKLAEVRQRLANVSWISTIALDLHPLDRSAVSVDCVAWPNRSHDRPIGKTSARVGFGKVGHTASVFTVE